LNPIVQPGWAYAHRRRLKRRSTAERHGSTHARAAAALGGTRLELALGKDDVSPHRISARRLRSRTRRPPHPCGRATGRNHNEAAAPSRAEAARRAACRGSRQLVARWKARNVACRRDNFVAATPLAMRSPRACAHWLRKRRFRGNPIAATGTSQGQERALAPRLKPEAAETRRCLRTCSAAGPSSFGRCFWHATPRASEQT
jgi:hypothetical protein